MSNKSTVIIGIAAAAAVGAAIGFLFAPEKGADLRKKVQQRANSWADELLDAIQKGKDNAQQMADDAQNKAKSWKNNVKAEFENATDTASRKVDATFEAII